MWNCRDGISSKKLALLIAVGGLAACSGEPVEQSSEAFSAMADVHNNPDVIASTAEIDQLLIDQDPTGNWMASVFDADTVLLERRLTDHLGASVSIAQREGGKGEMIIKYGSLDELDGLIQRLNLPD